jgi:arylsulfatase A
MVLPHRHFRNTPDNLNLVRSNDIQQLFAGMVAYMDKLIGRIVTTINELGLREKTIIIFTGDNGTDRLIVSSMGRTSMRGGKGEMTDLGTHVPLIASWEGVIPEGLVCNDLIDFTDIFPTFADIAGIEVQSELKIDGRSFLPQLKGQKGDPRKWVFLQYYYEQAVRTRYWKLNNLGWIFDMKKDPFEKHPIIKSRDTNDSAIARKNLEKFFNKIISKR